MTDRPKGAASTVRFLALAALLGAAVGVGAIYVRSAGERNESASCSPDTQIVERLKPLAHGEVAGVLVPAEAARCSRRSPSRTREAKPLTLADFAGRTVLLNLWATWCAPCREEMPALDRLQSDMGGEKFEVVAVSIDTQDPQKPRDFLNELKIEKLGFYADPVAGLFQTLKMAGRAVGLPTSILIDGSGCEIGYLPGPADWASEDAKALIRAAIGP